MKKEIIAKLKAIDVLNLKNQSYQKDYEYCIYVFKAWCELLQYPYCVESFYCFMEEFGEINEAFYKSDNYIKLQYYNNSDYWYIIKFNADGDRFWQGEGLYSFITEFNYPKLLKLKTYNEFKTNMVTE